MPHAAENLRKLVELAGILHLASDYADTLPPPKGKIEPYNQKRVEEHI